MPETITLNGDEYELEGKPSMGTVKYVQELQIDILQDYISDEQILEMDSMQNDEVMGAILEGEDGIENLKDMMWENNILETAQTIILATDHHFSLSEFEELGAMEFKEAKEESEVALGSESDPQTAADFMEDLGIGISSRVKEIQKEAEQKLESESGSQSPLLSE